MRTRHLVPVLLLTLGSLAACGGKKGGSDDQPLTIPDSPPTGHIVIDHILIGIRGAPRLTSTRSVPEAKAFAYDLLKKLQGGADWESAKQANSEDGPTPPHGGPYPMSDNGYAPAPGDIPRSGMVPAFGNVGFALKVGDIGIADYDPVKSPYGFHIIKRIR